MYRSLALSLIGLDTVFLLSLPLALAQRPQSRGESPECTAALQNARNRIEKSRKVKVVDIPKFDIRQAYGYKDYPENRPVKYEFHLKGSATDSVLRACLKTFNRYKEQLLIYFFLKHSGERRCTPAT
jgi:hypothetical protein